MTPWQRALRATGLVLALGAGAVVSPYGAGASYGAVQSVRPYDDPGGGALAAPSAPSAPGKPSRAGSRAGEGRERPGRPEDPERERGAGEATAVPEESREAVPEPSAATEQPVREAAAARADRPVGPVLRILPLGSGLMLIGLGLGLAFFALRLRRV
ncbi:hypothetical protein STAFG_0476 [Streptomyces afghaniensis 772]|uniref:Uncharacterized protein n=1 Tax=Streptomyces afghaniensis 772 TaxID=1283301 RepID=S4NVC1_9ACTN|nr:MULTISPECIES: hypothetical protein [Streptomyces]EPJ42464.1 hypothetical protein STAFG_0476 [Streptomyces afghaniensis 772]UOB11586.1 hypothetical protein MQE23_22020 [Streptomyces sp. HP-A2021]